MIPEKSDQFFFSSLTTEMAVHRTNPLFTIAYSLYGSGERTAVFAGLPPPDSCLGEYIASPAGGSQAAWRTNGLMDI